MSELSPAAQAVMTAYLTGPMHNDHRIADMLGVAAALRAAADQVALPIPDDCVADVFNRQLQIRAELLAIAAELEAQP
jgi:hypothetical protein